MAPLDGSGPAVLWRTLALLLALICGTAVALLSRYYPLGGGVAMPASVALVAALACRWPLMWLLLVAPLLPWIGLAPWTGWIGVEEFDLLVLAVASGGLLRHALWPLQPRRPSSRARLPDAPAGRAAAVLIALAVLAVTAVGVQRGLADSGGWLGVWSGGWTQGYREPLNTLRLAKPALAALLLWALWWQAAAARPERALRWLSLGLALGLGGAALACVWERAAYVGLADFSTDYRTTALFWEMHVGGAALDGFLALTLPFAVHQLLIARHPLRWALAAALCVLGAYAALSTFSRILYIALPLGLATLAVLHALQQRNRSMKISGEVSDTLTDEPEGPAWPAALVLIGGFAAMAASIFPGSGYRGMLALLGNLLLLLLLGPRLRRLGTVQWVTAAVLSLVGAMAVLALHWFTDKGAYIAHGLTLFIAATLALLRPRAARGALLTLAVAGYAPLLLASALVTRHWGGDEALRGALPALLLLAVALPAVACVRRHRPWPRSLRWQASVLSAMAVSAVAVGVFGGGAYMGERFAGGNADQSGRVAQWRQSIEWLRTPNQWLLGIGLGRFPDHYAQTAAADQRPSDHRLRREPDRSTLLLSAGPWSAAGSGTLHLSQRIARPRGVLTVKLRVRSALEAALHIDLCQKHLIYSTGCISGVMAVAALPGEWQRLSLTLDAGEKLQMADWFASPSVVFSLSTESFQAPLEIAEIAMTDGLGRPLLANGQWRQDLTRWFLTSERFHKPWHAHNLAVHLLVEQGVLGLGLWAGLSLAALWRLSVGRARAHPLAPALAAALVGFWVVGGIDSLLDLPRIATLFMLLLLLAFKLPTVGPMWAAAAGSPR